MSQYTKKYLRQAAKETLAALDNNDPRAYALILAISAITGLDHEQIKIRIKSLTRTKKR